MAEILIFTSTLRGKINFSSIFLFLTFFRVNFYIFKYTFSLFFVARILHNKSVSERIEHISFSVSQSTVVFDNIFVFSCYHQRSVQPQEWLRDRWRLETAAADWAERRRWDCDGGGAAVCPLPPSCLQTICLFWPAWPSSCCGKSVFFGIR